MRSWSLAMAGALALSTSVVHAGGARPSGAPPDSNAGAPPPTVLSSNQLIALRRILAPFNPATLNAKDVRAIRNEFESAGLKTGPALDAALAREGFSRKRMEALLPLSPQAAPPSATPPADRKFPRPQ